MSRREVARAGDARLGEHSREAAVPSRISQILTAWHVDPRCMAPEGRPAMLPATGDGPSQTSLLKHCAGDTPRGAVIQELEELGLVERHSQGFRVPARDCKRSGYDPDLIRQSGVALHDHGTTIAFNVDAKRAGAARFERMATNQALPRRHLRAFEAYLDIETEGQAPLEKTDAWPSARCATDAHDIGPFA